MYSHKIIEPKWQKIWLTEKANQAEDFSSKDKKYILDMFPYPSGEGLHTGHPEGYTATDILSRFYRFQGFNVIHPIGWDAFGLPAENYAIKKGTPPWETIPKNIANFKRQIQSLGFSYDWDREINTSDPEYYRWTQWLFLQLYKAGLAYKKAAPVNWCDSCQTVLANEQVVGGKCERCSSEVSQKNLEQWFFKVTQYAEELLKEIDNLDWPEPLKAAQRNWIGKSSGAEIKFKLKDSGNQVKETIVFTTRPDTIFGATFLVVSPELAKDWIDAGWLANSAVITYIKESLERRIKDPHGEHLKKTGIFAGLTAINPANNQEISVWIADYVLGGYGTGAIMAVPAHDERDFEFAKKFDLPVVEVIKPLNQESASTGCFCGLGELINSGEFTGRLSEKAFTEITKKIGAKLTTRYKIRDWLVSRQRFWGAPIPIIYCVKCGLQPVLEKDLPVRLPDDVDFKPTGESPLKRSKKFQAGVVCPKCGKEAQRECDTLDTFVCSSWYFLRYTDPNNAKEAFAKPLARYWLPVDIYVGGMEHAVGHFIFSRFVTKALADQNYLPFREPFLKIRNQGTILAEDGEKMSKSRGNVVNPDEVVANYGADTLRLYEMFMGPFADTKPWNMNNIMGVRRFLDRAYTLITEPAKLAATINGEVEKLIHRTIKKVSDDIEGFNFNTAISALMILLNELVSKKDLITQEQMEKFVVLLAPFAPHLAEELWQVLGHQQSIFKGKWLKVDKKYLVDNEVTVVIQINGKVRAELLVPIDLSVETLKEKVLALPVVEKYLASRVPKKVIVIPNKLVNIVV
ncbi:MAG: leucine--tRNA ligase [Candidatus Komeilibacteria bacterium]|nr:leucine--tRNA ligase [Candidatus Komeilibacteria bacterium]